MSITAVTKRDGARKARGAFFTPAPVAEFVTQWAIQSSNDRVLDPSCGDAAFLVPVVERLRALGSQAPVAHGVEIHPPSAQDARTRVKAAAGCARIEVSDFFEVPASPQFDAVVGNPPYVRYQGFTGRARALARAAALRAGVSLTALASSWAAFVIHAAQFLVPGGRLGFVLPAELLSVNYAAPVRRYLFDHFSQIELVLFDRQVFPDAETDVLLLLATGFGESTSTASIRQVTDSASLENLPVAARWTPSSPEAKWTDVLVDPAALNMVSTLKAAGLVEPLGDWGRVRLGAVTGNNRYFTLSPARVHELGLSRRDLVRVSPPGSAHLRGLELTSAQLTALGRAGHGTWLFHPRDSLNNAAHAYVDEGRHTGVDQAYKCRVRHPWYRVPLLPVPDLLLTCMNADTPRLTTNTAGVHHLNSVHGVNLHPDVAELGRDLLPIASLNSITLLSAELRGRSYGGGILKLEPREAADWAMPSAAHIRAHADALAALKPRVTELLSAGELLEAVSEVDKILFDASTMPAEHLSVVRDAHARQAQRRIGRGRRHGSR